ncbi:hypothetical protein TPY_2140 [Sulfobacillus acidophilus TPY]|nr:hypothetical protein TPY_2140 [Sulfobacillus acidophilus TPY]
MFFENHGQRNGTLIELININQNPVSQIIRGVRADAVKQVFCSL